jgi:hypothetical protein
LAVAFLTVAAHASHEEFVAAGPRHPIFRLFAKTIRGGQSRRT